MPGVSTSRQTRTKRIGRPPLGPKEGKRAPLSIRTTLDLRADLEKASKASGRSLAQEVEHRLEQSFRHEARAAEIAQTARREAFGSESRYKLMLILAGLIGLIEERHGHRSWLSDRPTFRGLKAAVVAFLDSMGPKRQRGKGPLHDVDFSEIEGKRIGQEFAALVRETIEAKKQKSKP